MISDHFYAVANGMGETGPLGFAEPSQPPPARGDENPTPRRKDARMPLKSTAATGDGGQWKDAAKSGGQLGLLEVLPSHRAALSGKGFKGQRQK